MNILTEELFRSIIQFCDWKDRENCRSLSKQLAKFTKSSAFYRWCCERLAEEHCIYISQEFPTYQWESIFKEFYPLRNMWQSGENVIAPEKSKTFKINVYARFRPSTQALKRQAKVDVMKASEPEESTVEVNLPLHQRLAMIKISHRLSSNKEALKVLAAEGGWFHKKWTGVNTEAKDSRIVDENEDPTNIPK